MISCILVTARESYPIIGLPDVHVFEPTFRSLERQSFRDFELIVVDALYPKRKEWVEKHEWSFPVKYVPPHSNHRFWLDRGLWNVSGMLNTALLYAEGDLIVRLDDCCEIPDKDYLGKFWEYYESGLFAMAMHVRYLKGKPARVDENYLREGYEARYAVMPKEDRAMLLKRLYGEQGIVRDTRWPTVEKHGRMIAPPEWGYGYTSYSLDAILRVNGYNELFDGCKGQEDQDLTIRMHMAGYKDMFILDKDLWVIEHEHYPCVVKSPPAFKCNYALIQYERAKGLYRANDWILTRENCDWIRENICSTCPNLRRCVNETLKGAFYVDNELFNLWLNHQSIFDLREERLEV